MHNILLWVNLPNSSGWRNTELFHLSIILVHLYVPCLVFLFCILLFALQPNNHYSVSLCSVLHCIWMDDNRAFLIH